MKELWERIFHAVKSFALILDIIGGVLIAYTVVALHQAKFKGESFEHLREHLDAQAETDSRITLMGIVFILVGCLLSFMIAVLGIINLKFFK